MKRAPALLLVSLVLAAPAARGEDTLPAELSLDAALRIGRTHQPQLRQAQALSEAAEARVDQARAALLPQINLTAGYSRSTANFAPRAGGTTPRRPSAPLLSAT